MRDPSAGPEDADAGSDAESGDDAAVDATEEDPAIDASEDEDDAPTLAAILGAEDEELPPREPLVPEQLSPENVLFVVLGVLLGGYVFWRAAAVFSP